MIYRLTVEDIDKVVPVGSIGNYRLDSLNQDNKFIVRYVGRSDTDLNGRLKDHVGEYGYFSFKTQNTVRDAFEQECKDYHHFREQITNARHPDQPEGKNYPCPVEGCPNAAGQ